MVSPGQVFPATWESKDFADFEALTGIITVDIFDGALPPVQLDARGYDTLAYLGEVGNPLITEACAAFKTARNHRPAADDDGETALALWRDLQDKALAAILVTPRYCCKQDLVDGKPPPGYLWYGSFTGEQRRRLVDFFTQGAAALKSFRAATRQNGDALRAGEGIRDAVERMSDSEVTRLLAVVAGRGDAPLAQPPARGSRAGRKQRQSA